MIDRTNLVYTEKSFQDGHMTQPAMQPLRHIEAKDPKHIVNGVGYNEEHFNHHFKFWYDKVIEDWTNLGLIVDGEPISKAGFTKLIDIHQNGRGQNKDFKAYIGNGLSGMYQMESSFRESGKKTFVNVIYKKFLKVIEGDLEAFDGGSVTSFHFGNSGISLNGQPIYYREY